MQAQALENAALEERVEQLTRQLQDARQEAQVLTVFLVYWSS